MRKLILSLAALAAMFAGCQKPELESPFGCESSFVASVEAFSPQSKTTMNSDRQVLWTADDRIAIFQGSTLADEYAIDESCAGKVNAVFNLVEDNSSVNGSFSAGSELPCNIAFYPYAAGLSLMGAAMEDGRSYEIEGYSLPSVQHYAANSFGNGAFPMVAVTANMADHSLKFKNVLGALKLQLKGTLVVKSIKVEGRNSERLSGAATVTAYTNKLNPAITMTGTDEASKSVTLDCGDGVQLNTSSATDFIISLPPVLFETGFTVTVTDSDAESYTITAGIANTVLRSSILVMPEVILGEVDDDSNIDSSYDITIDGDFSDWDALIDVATATCAPNAIWTALKTLKAYADADALYIYFEFSEDEIIDREWVPFNVHINQDNNTEGCGDDQWLGQGGQDWLLQGCVIANGEFCSYDPGLYMYVGVPTTVEWAYEPILSEGSGFVLGMGSGNKYELMIIKEACLDIEWADTFSLGVSILQDWNSVGVLPNADVTEDNPNGITHMLSVTHESTNSSSIKAISLNYYLYTLYEGDNFELIANIYPSNVTDNSIVWSSDDTTIAIVDQSGFVTAVSEGTTTIYAVVDGKKAKCIVTVKKPSEATVDYIDEYGINHGKGTAIGMAVWAPVNCGYHATDYQWGKLYQWGRKYGQGYDGSLYDFDWNVIGSVTDATVPELSEGGVSLQGGQSSNNENVFFIGTSDWLYQRDDQLWNSGTEDSLVKTEYDPCPKGWRVPTYAELKEFSQNHSEWTNNVNGQSGYWFSGPSSYSSEVAQVFFPAAGGRNYYDGYAGYRGSNGYYWSSRPYSYSAYCLYFYSGSVNVNYDRNPADGFSVRCVQE